MSVSTNKNKNPLNTHQSTEENFQSNRDFLSQNHTDNPQRINQKNDNIEKDSLKDLSFATESQVVQVKSKNLTVNNNNNNDKRRKSSLASKNDDIVTVRNEIGSDNSDVENSRSSRSNSMPSMSISVADGRTYQPQEFTYTSGEQVIQVQIKPLPQQQEQEQKQNNNNKKKQQNKNQAQRNKNNNDQGIMYADIEEEQEKQSYEICNLFLSISMLVFIILALAISWSDSSMQMIFLILFVAFYIFYLVDSFRCETYKYLNNIVDRRYLKNYLTELKTAQPLITVITKGSGIDGNTGAKVNVYDEKKELEIKNSKDLSNTTPIQKYLRKLNYQDSQKEQENKPAKALTEEEKMVMDELAGCNFRLKTTFKFSIVDKSLQALQQQMKKDAEKKGGQIITEKVDYQLKGIQENITCMGENEDIKSNKLKMYFIISTIFGFSWIYRIRFYKKMPLLSLKIQKVINSKL